MIYDTVVWNVCSILHCKNCVYLCNYDLFPILLHLWQRSKECMYVCVYVCFYVCMYVHGRYPCQPN